MLEMNHLPPPNAGLCPRAIYNQITLNLNHIIMQDPAREITEVVTLLTTAVSPDIQKATVEKFFTSDAGFSHPVCAVKRGPDSRDTLLGIYQFVC